MNKRRIILMSAALVFLGSAPSIAIAQSKPSTVETVDLSTMGAQKKPQGSAPANQIVRPAPNVRAVPRQSAPLAAGATAAAPVASAPPHEGPRFKLIFDLFLQVRPSIAPLTFRSFHTLFLVEYVPTPEVQFSAEVSPSPRYYEFDYQFSRKFQLRAGRIWIPFDDLNPHNSFGGRVNTSPLNEDPASAFLPDLWADLGLGMKYQPFDSRSFSLLSHLYVVNGFTDGGIDPNGTTAPYPNFSGTTTNVAASVIDNNTDKAIGGRVQMGFKSSYFLGASVYSGRYTDEDAEAGRILIYGLDTKLKFSFFDVGIGYVEMTSDMLSPSPYKSFTRGGIYADLMFRITDKFRFKTRAGFSIYDMRLITPNDQTILGGDLVYNLGIAEIGLTHNQDIDRSNTAKSNFSFTALKATLVL